MSHLKKPKTEHLNIILHLQQEKDISQFIFPQKKSFW